MLSNRGIWTFNSMFLWVIKKGNLAVGENIGSISILIWDANKFTSHLPITHLQPLLFETSIGVWKSQWMFFKLVIFTFLNWSWLLAPSCPIYGTIRYMTLEYIKLGNRHTLCRRFGKGLACVGPSGRRNLPTIMVYQPTAGMNCVTMVWGKIRNGHL